MQRITLILSLLFMAIVFIAPAAEAWLFGNSALVNIDGDVYSDEDFERWWKFWQEEGMSLPETPDPYVDWLLLAREGRRMDLENDPAFMRTTRVFIQSRALLMLKNEEVDSRIKVTDAEIRKVYEEHFVPRWGLEGVQFIDEEAAKVAWQELSDGKVTIAALLERPVESGGPVKTAETWLRPRDLEKSAKWRAIYENLALGEVLDPKELGQNKVLYYLKEIKEGDAEDFAKVRETIKDNLWDDQARTLTNQLLADLRDKYEVKVDEERIDAVDIKADPESLSDDPVITSNQQNVSEKEFVAIMHRVLETRPMLAHSMTDDEESKAVKRDTVTNIVAQSVTNWESLDRHYEEKEPFKWQYEFNRDHRLGQHVVRRMIDPQAQVTDEEIAQEYELNKSRYSVPAQVRLYIIDETRGPVDKVWADVAAGMNFEEALKEHLQGSTNIQQVPFNHLAPEIKEVVKNLSEGEASRVFIADGVKVMVYLHERLPEVPIPFERVKGSIHESLFEKKRDQLLAAYLDQIKAGTDIEVQQKQWYALQKKLGGQ